MYVVWGLVGSFGRDGVSRPSIWPELRGGRIDLFGKAQEMRWSLINTNSIIHYVVCRCTNNQHSGWEESHGWKGGGGRMKGQAFGTCKGKFIGQCWPLLCELKTHYSTWSLEMIIQRHCWRWQNKETTDELLLQLAECPGQQHHFHLITRTDETVFQINAFFAIAKNHRQVLTRTYWP